MLTNTEVRNLQPKAKQYKVADSGGMYLDVRPSGAKYWRLKYRIGGKEKLLALGVYPEIGLKDARKRRDDAKRQMDEGIDPGQQRKVEKLTAVLSAANTFEAIALEWQGQNEKHWAPITAHKIKAAFESSVLPHLGVLPIADITPAALLAMLRKVEATGKNETAHRLRAWCSQVFRYGIQTQRCDRDPAADLKGALKSAKTTHRAALPAAELPSFLRKLNDASARIEYRTRLALRLLVLTFVRPGELRAAAWSEFDTDKAEWRIPAERMKMKEEHIVPLSAQAIAVLEDLRQLTGSGRLVFPCVGNPGKPMSDNTLCRSLQYGLGLPVTAHGFRATATSTLLELGWLAHVIDRQLGHRERKQVFGAYSHMAQYMEERRRMMQAWGDHLAALEQGAEVILLRAGAA
jgi:integrase